MTTATHDRTQGDGAMRTTRIVYTPHAIGPEYVEHTCTACGVKFLALAGTEMCAPCGTAASNREARARMAEMETRRADVLAHSARIDRMMDAD